MKLSYAHDLQEQGEQRNRHKSGFGNRDTTLNFKVMQVKQLLSCLYIDFYG